MKPETVTAFKKWIAELQSMLVNSDEFTGLTGRPNKALAQTMQAADDLGTALDAEAKPEVTPPTPGQTA